MRRSLGYSDIYLISKIHLKTIIGHFIEPTLILMIYLIQLVCHLNQAKVSRIFIVLVSSREWTIFVWFISENENKVFLTKMKKTNDTLWNISAHAYSNTYVPSPKIMLNPKIHPLPTDTCLVRQSIRKGLSHYQSHATYEGYWSKIEEARRLTC